MNTVTEPTGLLSFLPDENSRAVMGAYFRCPLYRKRNITAGQLVEIVCGEFRKTLFRALSSGEGNCIAGMLKVVQEHPAEAEAFAAHTIATMCIVPAKRGATRGRG